MPVTEWDEEGNPKTYWTGRPNGMPPGYADEHNKPRGRINPDNISEDCLREIASSQDTSRSTINITPDGHWYEFDNLLDALVHWGIPLAIVIALVFLFLFGGLQFEAALKGW